MNITTMKTLAFFAALSLSAAAVAAAPQATSLDQLLDQVKSAAQQRRAQNQQRETQFRQAADQHH